MFKTFAFRSSKQVKFNAFGCIKNMVRLKLTRAMQILMTRCVPKNRVILSYESREYTKIKDEKINFTTFEFKLLSATILISF